METINYVLVAWVCMLFIACGNRKEEQAEVLPVKVKTQLLDVSASGVTHAYSGTVEEGQGASLSFFVPGTVQRIYVKVGSQVKKGDLLASLDPATFKSSYEAAKATLAQAQDAYNRMKELYDKKSLPEIKWIDVQSKLQQAVSMERIARENLNHCSLYSPFSGIISEKEIEVGQNATPGVPVLKLNSVSQVKVKIAVPESDISNVRMNGKADVTVSALDGRTFTGSIVEKGVEAHPLSHSYEVKVLVDNTDGSLMPGMVTKTLLQATEPMTHIVLPVRLVQLDELNRTFVWIKQDGKARRRIIMCGDYVAGGVVVLSGLTGKEEIVVEGQHKISEGTSITAK